MLSYYHTGIDADDVEAGESERDGLAGQCIEVGLVVGGHEYGTVDDDEVGVGGWQPFAIVEDGVGHGKPQEAVGVSVGCAQRAELLLQSLEILVLWVVLIVATHIEQSVVGCKSDDGVDVPVGVVADEISMVEPYDASGMESPAQLFLNFLLGEGLVAVGCQQTGAGSEDGTFAVAFDRPSFKHKVVVNRDGKIEKEMQSHLIGNLIVEVGRKFLTPSIELEIEHQTATLSVGQCDATMVACPGVVGVAFAENDFFQCLFAERLLQCLAYGSGLGRDNNQPLVVGDDLG